MWPLALPLRRHRATIQIPSQALPEVTIPAFLFLLFCKIIPLCSLRPLLSPTRLPDLMSLAGVLREEPVCLGAMATLCGWRRHTGCSAVPGGTLGCHQDVGVEGGQGWWAQHWGRSLGLGSCWAPRHLWPCPCTLGPRLPGAAARCAPQGSCFISSWVPEYFHLPVFDAAVRAGVSTDPTLAESPPGSRISRGRVTPILQLGKQQRRSPRVFPWLYF